MKINFLKRHKRQLLVLTLLVVTSSWLLVTFLASKARCTGVISNRDMTVFGWLLENDQEIGTLEHKSSRPSYRNVRMLRAYFASLPHQEPRGGVTFHRYQPDGHVPAVLDKFYREINQDALCTAKCKWRSAVETLVRHGNMSYVTTKKGGTQLKMFVGFENSTYYGLLKPQRMRKDLQMFPDHYYFTDIERPNAEVAAYHVDKLLNFRRVMPTVGRVIDLREMRQLAEDKFKKTFFTSPGNNTCVIGQCSYYCESETPVCGRPHLVEASIALFLPDTTTHKRKTIKHPFKRTYSKRNLEALWEKNETYCETSVKNETMYSKGRRIYDIADLAVFDFIIDNMDRHHYEIWESFGDHSSILHLDQGRSFGRFEHDDLSIIAPVRQCCKMRWSTWQTLLRLQQFGLGDLLHDSLADELIAPVLADQHYRAVDRRLETIIDIVSKCAQKNTKEQVFDIFDATVNSSI